MDWAELYAKDTTPWDMGQAHPELTRRLESGTLAPGEGATRALVPGCGKGHDALALARAGFAVTAVDIVDGLQAELGPALDGAGGRLVVTDALAFRDAHDLLFEHTFFCALPPELRPAYGEMARHCVAPGGMLHAVVFPVDKQPRGEGPPFQMTLDDLDSALGEAFEQVEASAIDPIEGRGWGARWASYRRR